MTHTWCFNDFVLSKMSLSPTFPLCDLIFQKMKAILLATENEKGAQVDNVDVFEGFFVSNDKRGGEERGKEREKKIGNWHRYWKSYPRQQTLVYYNATIKMICSLLFYFILILNVSSLLNFNLCSCFTLFTGCLLVACSGL